MHKESDSASSRNTKQELFAGDQTKYAPVQDGAAHLALCGGLAISTLLGLISSGIASQPTYSNDHTPVRNPSLHYTAAGINCPGRRGDRLACPAATYSSNQPLERAAATYSRRDGYLIAGISPQFYDSQASAYARESSELSHGSALSQRSNSGYSVCSDHGLTTENLRSREKNGPIFPQEMQSTQACNLSHLNGARLAQAKSSPTYLDNEQLIAAIRSLGNAKLQVKDAPSELFGVSAANHTNGMARIGPWWITNYPNVDRAKGRILYWNDTKDDYQEPKVIDTEGGYPAGMDAAERFLAVTHAKNKIRFFQFNNDEDGGLTELTAYAPPTQATRESVGLAYHPERKIYYMISNQELFKGTPGGDWTKIGTVDRKVGYSESQPMIYLGNDRFAVFALMPDKNGSPYEFSFFLFSVNDEGKITQITSHDEYIGLSSDSQGEAGGAPSFRWAGTMTFDGKTFTLYAAPKRLDASGNYYFWESTVSQSALAEIDYNVKVVTGKQSGAGTDSNIYLKIVGQDGETALTHLNGHISGNAFENGDTDWVTLRLKNVGKINGIQVLTDGKYSGSAWNLDSITVNGKLFECGCWLDSANPLAILTPK